MKLLLDTHFLIWLIEAPKRITQAEWRCLQRAEQSTYISTISLWELRIKWDSTDRKGNRKGTIDPFDAVSFIERGRMIVTPLTANVAVAPLQSPVQHADPFDRMLLVHAQELEARFLTRDEKLRDHPLALSV